MPSSLVANVLRSSDLLGLKLEFLNLALQLGSDPSLPPRLVPVAADQPSFIAVEFPPQHIAERVLPDQAPAPDPPYEAAISGSSRLVFELPAATPALDYSLNGVLELLRTLPLSQPVLPDGSQGTSIEFPYRLVLAPAPGTTAQLYHRSAPGTSPSTGWVELWHTRLGTDKGDLTIDQSAGNPALQAVTNLEPGDLSFLAALCGRDRTNIVGNSQQNHGGIIAEQFMLSALGASVRLRSEWPSLSNTLVSWQHRTGLARDQHVQTVTLGFLFPFRFRASVTTVTNRTFLPSPDIAALVQTATVKPLERERSYAGETAYTYGGAEMPLKRITIVGPDEQPLPPPGSEPWVSFTVVAEDSTGSKIGLQLKMLFIAAEDITNGRLGAFQSQYQQDNAADFAAQLVALADVVPGPDADAPAERGDTRLNVAKMYFDTQINTAIDPPFLPHMTTAEVSLPALRQFLGSTSVNSSATEPSAIIKHSDLYLNSRGLRLDDDTNRRHVFADLLSSLSGLSIPPERAGGFVAPNFAAPNVISRFGLVINPPPDIPLINPAQLLKDARLLGTIDLIDIIGQIGQGTDFDLRNVSNIDQLIPDDHVIIGMPVLNTQYLPSMTAPETIVTRFVWKPPVNTASGLIEAGPGDGGIRLTLSGKVITYVGANPSGPGLEIDGTLKNFALPFGGDLVRIVFNQVAFKAGSGRKIEVVPDISDIIFGDALSFVNEIRQILPHTNPVGAAAAVLPADPANPGGFGGTPNVEVRPDGAVIRYDLGIPSFGIGVLSFQNIALASSISVSFVQGIPTAVRFRLSERAHPFLVTVGPFGGGGFFALEMRTGGKGPPGTDLAAVVLVEASVEFGANVSFDIGIARGGVYLMAGVYYSSTPAVTLTGFVRCGGYLEILEIASISVEFYIGLTYSGGKLAGDAVLTVGIRVLFFSTSVTLSVHKEIASFGAGPTDQGLAGLSAADPTPAPPTFEKVVTLLQWQQYCQAFA